MLNTGDPFGGAMKTCSVSGAFMAENADVLVPQGMTEAQLSGAQAKGQLGVLFAKAEKGELTKYAKVATGVNDNGDTFHLSYVGTKSAGKSTVHAFDLLKIKKNGQSATYSVSKNSAFLQDIMDEAKWKFGNASTPTVAAGPSPATASVGAMSDEDVSTLFVLIKDDLAKKKGINIKGANPELDKEVFANIGERIGYTADEVSAKIDAYKATGKKLSALKKKALKEKPTIPPKPKPATKPVDLETIEDLKPASEPLHSDSMVKMFTKDIENGYIASVKEQAAGAVSPKIKASAQKALQDKGLDWNVEPNGVPTQATVKVKEEILDVMDEKGLSHAYTDEDLAAQYIMAKDQVVADSGGKWTLYSKSDEMDQAIYDMIQSVTGRTKTQVEEGVKNYLASGKKLSVLKKQLIKSGKMEKAAPTLKGGTKATKANVNAFADKGFTPKDAKPTPILGSSTLQEIYVKFKTNPGTYISSSPESIYDALLDVVAYGKQQTASTYWQEATELDVLRWLDIYGAKKFGVENEYLFEKKIVEWAASPEGKSYIQAKLEAQKLEAMQPSLPADSNAFQVIDVHHAKAMQDRLEPWKPEEKSGLRTYTGGSYREMNSYLRGKQSTISPSLNTAIKNAENGMRAVDEPFLVHRGTGYKQFEVHSYEEVLALVGKNVADKGFLSTSVGGMAAFGGEVKMEIEVAKGTKGAFVKYISHFSGENEFIIAPGTKMKVLQVKKQGYQTVVRLRTIP